MSNTESTTWNADAPTAGPGIVRERFDWDDYEPISSVVVSAVAEAAGVCEYELDELYDHVEPSALDQLFGSMRSGPRPADGFVCFAYGEYLVTVYSHGVVTVQPETSDPATGFGDPR